MRSSRSAHARTLPQNVVEREESAKMEREGITPVVLDVDVVFSQARNSRLKRLEESLNQGFPIDKEDARGNTLLLVAAQNCNQKMCEMLLRRNANVNHQNVNGNTALHYAMAYDNKVRETCVWGVCLEVL
jgi:ankyrin repeat protein